MKPAVILGAKQRSPGVLPACGGTLWQHEIMRNSAILLLFGLLIVGCQSEKPSVQKPEVQLPHESESQLPHERVNAELLDAAEKGDAPKVRQLLQARADVDVEDTNGWTPLIFAAKAGNEAIVELLVRKGADVNHRSTTEIGTTVLGFATGGNNPAVIDYLLTHGADINGKARNGTTPLQYTCFQGNTNLAALLISRGADLNLPGQIDSEGHPWTPLTTAGNSRHVEMIKLLIDRGALLEQTNEHGDTALMEVSKRDVPEAVKLLIERGANVNAKGPFGHTALIYAAYNGQSENIRLLLTAGADPLARATDSENPADQKDPLKSYIASTLAMQQEHPEALALIRAVVEKARAGQTPNQSK